MHEVLITFRDDMDSGRIYRAGKDKYPRSGYKPDKKRITYLAGNKNKLGKPVIAAPVPATEAAPPQDEPAQEE